MPLQMASQALSAGQVAEQGRVLWHWGDYRDTLSAAGENTRGVGGDLGGILSVISLPLNRLLQLGGCQTLRF